MELNYSLHELNDAAKRLLEAHPLVRVFALHGSMGAGKTTLVHALATQLQVVDTVSSPTFAIINTYVTAQGAAVHHLDLYRLRSEEEAIQAGVEDCLHSGDYCFAEWPEIAPDLFPDTTLHVYIESTGTDTRRLITQ